MAHESLAGLSVGDAFGNENFTPRTVVVLPGAPEGVWPWTDDTQMACSLVEVLVRHGRVEQAELARAFAARGERFRDYGRGALRFMEAIRRGGDWREASVGLFDGIGSWGNGGAMRVTPLGAWFADDLDRAATEAAASAEVTHAHPEGIAGGIAAGVAAAWAAGRRGRVVEDPAEVLEIVLGYVPDDAPLVRMGIDRARGLLGANAGHAARTLGNGTRISAQDTVPFALWVVATHFADYETAVRTCVNAGGDQDTMAAIVGGILAAHHGTSCIPTQWLARREPLPDWLP